MALIKDGRLIADPWLRLADEAPMPAAAPVLVSLARWRQDGPALTRRPAPVGLRLNDTDPVAAIAPELPGFAVIALTFPKFTNGRPYSQARLLRERMGYTGEIRATGEVLRDQLAFMRRCGFDAFEVPETAKLEDWLAAFTEIGLAYQPAGDRTAPVAALRRRGPAQPRLASGTYSRLALPV